MGKKTQSKDIQILLNIHRIQNEMIEYLDEYTITEIVNNDIRYERLFFNTLKIIGLTKNLTGKTVKERLGFIEKSKTDLLMKSLETCYPIASKESLVRYMLRIVGDESQMEVQLAYEDYVQKNS